MIPDPTPQSAATMTADAGLTHANEALPTPDNDVPSTVSTTPPYSLEPPGPTPLLVDEPKDRFKIKNCVNCKSLPCHCKQDQMKAEKKLLRKVRRREFLNKCVVM